MTAVSKKLLALSAAAFIALGFGGCARNQESALEPRTRAMASTNAEEMTVNAEAPSAIETQKSSTELASFSTDFNPKYKGRTSNIKLASGKIDSVVVNPGEVFSYNETLGPTSRKNGYKLGTIFIKGKMFEGYGGGVCQVSSTLYNAAANAGMEIIERHDHSMPVPYIETGKDAATSYGGIDFKFKNSKPFPVTINSNVSEKSVSVTINAIQNTADVIV